MEDELGTNVPQARRQSGRYWSEAEHERFLSGVSKFGIKDTEAIACHVGSRTPEQVRTHAQKHLLRLKRARQRNVERQQAVKELQRQRPAPPRLATQVTEVVQALPPLKVLLSEFPELVGDALSDAVPNPEEQSQAQADELEEEKTDACLPLPY